MRNSHDANFEVGEEEDTFKLKTTPEKYLIADEKRKQARDGQHSVPQFSNQNQRILPNKK